MYAYHFPILLMSMTATVNRTKQRGKCGMLASLLRLIKPILMNRLKHAMA